MRIHFFCAKCRDKHAPEPFVGNLPPLARRDKWCCFCRRWAVMRGRTNVPAGCPAGHIAPKRLEAIAKKAFAASTRAFNDLGEVMVTLPKQKPAQRTRPNR